MARDKDISQYDLGLVLRDVHDEYGQSLRVLDTRSVISGYYSHFSVDYNVDNNPETVKYYVGTQPHITNVIPVGDNNSDLNSTYFTIRSNPDNQKYHIWFNVDGLGVDPAPLGSIGIEVPISQNDPASVVSYAIEMVLKNFYSGIFDVYRKTSSLEIRTRQFGVIDNSVDFNTAFTIQNTQGEQRLVKQMDIEYVGSDPTYQGQILKGYYFDVYAGKFLKSIPVEVDLDDATDSVSAALSGHSSRHIALVTDDYLDVDLDTTAFTEVLAYTAPSALKVRTVNVNAQTFGSFRLKVNGVIQAYYQTSIMNRNVKFEFGEDLVVAASDVITIEFVPDRIQLPTYNFFMRLEAY